MSKIRLRETDVGFLAYSVVEQDGGEIEWFLGTALRIKKPHPRYSADFRPESPALYTGNGEILLTPLDIVRWFSERLKEFSDEVYS